MTDPKPANVGEPATTKVAAPADETIAFSESAVDAFDAAADQYVVDLTDVSAMLMRRQNMDAVSAAHVETAASLLATRSGRRSAKALSAFGGVLLGAGLGVFTSVMASEAPRWTSFSVAIALIFCTLGGVMMAVGLLRE
ncbi:hypothetical protein [Blastococcus sp. TF02A-35]|uniref:hypothetical protein n=1 Tax=Blastococcus sp. TF02A-35 TaxID=2559612 RepID=UPI00107426FA|nr:hypothetical protein [Blastococcus sp. TF02A_35]TFV52656.1 hypothetical protein E4P43_04980 [Blastococcus sp. TF02A_35]